MAADFGRIERERRGDRHRWILCFQVNGKRVRLHSGLTAHGDRVPFRDESMARAFLESIRADVRSGRTEEQALAPYLFRRSPANMVKARWERFIEDRRASKARGRRQITEGRIYDLERMPERGYLDFFDEVSIYELTSPLLSDWVDWLADRWPNHSTKTRHHVVNDFMSFVRFLKQRRDIAELPDKPELPAIDRRRRPVPSEGVLDRYLAAIPEDERGLFLLRSRDGVRISEARRLNVANYDWQARALSIVDTKTEAGRRSFEVDWEVADWLEAHVPPSERLDTTRPLFRNARADDGRWRADAEERIHREAVAAALGVDVEGVVDNPAYWPPNHAGRHAAASHMMRRTKQQTGAHDIDAVRRKLGHTARATTETYIDQDVIEVSTVRRLRPR
jgi:integrase